MDIQNFKGKSTLLTNFYIKFPHFNYQQFINDNELPFKNEEECIQYILDNEDDYKLQEKVFLQKHKLINYFNIFVGICINYGYSELINFDKYHIHNLKNEDLQNYDDKFTYVLVDVNNLNDGINNEYKNKIILYVNTDINDNYLRLIEKYNIKHFIVKHALLKHSLLTMITDYKVIMEDNDFDKCFYEIYNHKKKYELIPEKINVYRLGSCRTNYLIDKYDINTIDSRISGNFTHTTKEVIQQIKMLTNEINIDECEYPNCFTQYRSQQDYYKSIYNDADVILVEISSTKEAIDNKDFYYNTVELNMHYKPEGMPNNRFVYPTKMKDATMQDIKNDISILKSTINKPIIFQGHINMNFVNDTSKISNREVIDQSISNELNLTYENIFGDDKDKVCTKTEDGSIDVNHITEYAYNELYNNFVKILKENNFNTRHQTQFNDFCDVDIEISVKSDESTLKLMINGSEYVENIVPNILNKIHIHLQNINKIDVKYLSQVSFISFKYRKENEKIEQLYLSANLYKYKDDKRIHLCHKLNDYKDIYKPCFFYGIAKEQDIDAILNHKGKKYVIFSGGDIDLLYHINKNTQYTNTRWNFLKKLHNLDEIYYIPRSEFMINDMKLLNYKYTYYPFYGDAYSTYDIKPKGNKIYFYTYPDYQKYLYGHSVVEEIKKRKPEYEFILLTHNNAYLQNKEFCDENNISTCESNDELIKKYQQCFIAIRLTNHDGIANSVLELGSLGIKTIYNDIKCPASLTYNSIDDVINHIENERKTIGTIDDKLIENVKKFITPDENIYYTGFYE